MWVHYNNINIFIERGDYPYEKAGRIQSEEESIKIDKYFLTDFQLFLDDQEGTQNIAAAKSKFLATPMPRESAICEPVSVVRSSP